MSNPLSAIITPPNYLRMQAVGVDISDRSVKYIELTPHNGESKIGRFGEISLAPGIIEDGRIVHSSALVAELSKLSKEKGITFVRAALPEEQVYFFQMKVPNGEEKELYTSIELSLEEHVPIPALDTVFDFDVVSKTAESTLVVVTAVARSVVESYSSTFAEAGLTLLSLELEAEATNRAVVHKDDPTAHMIIDFGRMRTGISVVYGGTVHFTSTVSVGGQMLTDTLVKNFKISVEEAEMMKREYGMRRNSPRQDLFSVLLNNIAVLRDEINKHFIYWHTHNDENGMPRPPIEQIILVGGDSNLAGLKDYLSASLKVPAMVGDVWMNVPLVRDIVPEISKNDSLGYATAVGLALHDFSHE